MKTTSVFFKKVATATGLSLGAFAIAAVAATTWTPPPPPGPPDNNVDAPLNAGTSAQVKTGGVTLGGLGITSSNFIFKPSTAAVNTGSVLVATNADGTIGWGSAAAGAAIPNGITTYTANGTWQAPAGTTRVRVRIWGAGGGGGGRFNGSPANPGGGGGGGGYSEAVVPVTPLSTYTVTVGTGGLAGDNNINGGASRCGKLGGTSSFALAGTVYVSATGGGGGHSNVNSTCDNYNGGTGGKGTVNAPATGFNIDGGDGAAGTSGQAEGGNAPQGGQGTSNDKFSGPISPGGGGGGGVLNFGNGIEGAKGRVIIEY